MNSYAIATLANEHALKDIRLLLFSLELWNQEDIPTVYIYTDSKTKKEIEKIPYKGKIFLQEALNEYTGLNRSNMENLPGKKFTTLFADFCSEKTHLMKWSLESENGGGVLFCDADICHLGLLPRLPSSCRIALSPHEIRKLDTDKYGIFNAGYLFMRQTDIADKWFELCKTSRFFEQGCLEDLAEWCIDKYGNESVYHFPTKSINYGWWRLLQGDRSADDLVKEWSIKRTNGFSGISVGGEMLQSVHTHFAEKNDLATISYNKLVLSLLKKLSSVPKTLKLLHFIDNNF
jgi:hypothetical protein